VLAFLKRLFGQTVKPSGSIAPEPPRSAAAPVASAEPGRATSELPKHKTPDRGGGVYINSGTITVGGDIVGGNRVVVVSDDAIERLFEPLLTEAQKIVPDTLRVEARQRIIEIRDQAKSYDADLIVVGKALKWLMANTPSLVAKLRAVLADAHIPQSIRELAVVVLGGEAEQLSPL
jgi:hypothetical protein